MTQVTGWFSPDGNPECSQFAARTCLPASVEVGVARPRARRARPVSLAKRRYCARVTSVRPIAKPDTVTSCAGRASGLADWGIGAHAKAAGGDHHQLRAIDAIAERGARLEVRRLRDSSKACCQRHQDLPCHAALLHVPPALHARYEHGLAISRLISSTSALEAAIVGTVVRYGLHQRNRANSFAFRNCTHD